MTDKEEPACDCVFAMRLERSEVDACLWLHTTLKKIVAKNGENAGKAEGALSALGRMARQIELIHHIVHLMEESAQRHGVTFEFTTLDDLLAKAAAAASDEMAN